MNLIGRYLRYQEWESALAEYKRYDTSIVGWYFWDGVMERFNAYRAMCSEGMDGI